MLSKPYVLMMPARKKKPSLRLRTLTFAWRKPEKDLAERCLGRRPGLLRSHRGNYLEPKLDEGIIQIDRLEPIHMQKGQSRLVSSENANVE